MSAIQPATPIYQKPKKTTMSVGQRRRKKVELYEKQKRKCAYCLVIMTLSMGYPNTATLDHVEPEPRGCKKNDADSNLVCACWTCNNKKGSQRGWKPKLDVRPTPSSASNGGSATNSR